MTQAPLLVLTAIPQDLRAALGARYPLAELAGQRAARADLAQHSIAVTTSMAGIDAALMDELKGLELVVCNGAGLDKIDLADMDANFLAGGNQAFNWIGAQGFTGQAGQLHERWDNGKTIVEGDVNGDQVADFQIELSGTHVLTQSDFVL